MLDAADAYAAREGLDLPEEPAASVAEPEPSCVTTPILRLDLRDAGITTIIWSTGFAFDFGWLRVGALDARGAPMHRRGITEVPRLYVLGLPFLSRRASSFIFGVEQDAARPPCGRAVAAYIGANGLVEIGHDPLADLIEAHYRRMQVDGLPPQRRRRYVAWGNMPR